MSGAYPVSADRWPVGLPVEAAGRRWAILAVLPIASARSPEAARARPRRPGRRQRRLVPGPPRLDGVDPLRRALHDRVAGTLVVGSVVRRAAAAPEASRRASPGCPHAAHTAVRSWTSPGHAVFVDNRVAVPRLASDDVPARRGRDSRRPRDHINRSRRGDREQSRLLSLRGRAAIASRLLPRMRFLWALPCPRRASLHPAPPRLLQRRLGELRRPRGPSARALPARGQVGGSRFSRSVSGSAAGVAHRK